MELLVNLLSSCFVHSDMIVGACGVKGGKGAVGGWATFGALLASPSPVLFVECSRSGGSPLVLFPLLVIGSAARERCCYVNRRV